MKNLKHTSLILLSAIVLSVSSSWSVTAYGSEQATDHSDVQLINQLDTNLQTLKEIDRQSRQDLQKVNKQLTESLTELETVNKQFIELRIVNAQQKISLESANRSLESLNDELKVEKRRNNQLKFWLGATVLILLSNNK